MNPPPAAQSPRARKEGIRERLLRFRPGSLTSRAMGDLPDKRRVLHALKERIDSEALRIASSQRAAQAGAVHAETRQEGPKDTRAIEAGYLARGLAERAESLRAERATLDGLELRSYDTGTPIGVTALIFLESGEGDASRRVFLVPVAGGESLVVDGFDVKPVSPASPLGRALVGRTTGDEAFVRTPAGGTTWIVVAVA